MNLKQRKILIHFDTNNVCVSIIKEGKVELVKKEQQVFTNCDEIDTIKIIIDKFLTSLKNNFRLINNENTRLYATGIFQELDKINKEILTMHIFVHHGLYFNIIQPSLEQFYINHSLKKDGDKDIVRGLLRQEFRKVVICGSFQRDLEGIKELMDTIRDRNTLILSPWTTKIVPETIGTDFILFEGQEPLLNKRDTWKHKLIHMKAFEESDAIIVCNPDGIIGQGTMFEFGYMIAFSKRVIFTETPKDLSILFPYEVGLNF